MQVSLKPLTAAEFGQMVQQLMAQATIPASAWQQAGAFSEMAQGLVNGSLTIAEVPPQDHSAREP